jgi:peptidoglycan/xylan/chitin deacetylase (PgdA/CDA1 family)
MLDGKAVYQNDTGDVLFTFDDSPSPSTHAILDCLEQHHIKAVFFILTDNIPGNEAILDRMVREGHTLGNHGAKDRLHLFMSDAEFEADLLESDRILRQWQTPRWFRPGYGFFSDAMLATLQRHQYTMMLGNVFPFDSFIRSPHLNKWYVERKLDSGSIVILHDRPWTPPMLDLLFA